MLFCFMHFISAISQKSGANWRSVSWTSAVALMYSKSGLSHYMFWANDISENFVCDKYGNLCDHVMLGIEIPF